MIYGFQHFSAIEIGYRIKYEKQRLDQLHEESLNLRLAESQLNARLHLRSEGSPTHSTVKAIHPLKKLQVLLRR
jgi:hypothetical protein